MAEALGTGATIIAIVQISSATYLACQKYVIDVRHAKESIERLSQEILALQATLESAIEKSNTNATAFEYLRRPNGTVQQCSELLSKIDSKFEKDMAKYSPIENP